MGLYWHNLFARLQERQGSPPAGGLLRAAAGALSTCYGLGARMRRGLYARGCFQVKRLPAPVVSVGNLTVGGTGKTPVVACLARLLQGRGQRVAILSRGYGGRSRGVVRLSDGDQIFQKPPAVGEEAYWLARQLPGVAVYTGPCRHTAGLAAWREWRPDLFLLDDGFQHFQLHRDLDIVLLDAPDPYGNGRLLPRGPLREPPATLAAARVLLLTRFQAGLHEPLVARLEAAFPDQAVLTASIAPVWARSYPGGHEEPPAEMRNRALFAFAGVARPTVFVSTLQDLGVDLKGCHAFPDHHPWGADELRRLVQEARGAGAAALITTTKDWARLGEKWEADFLLWVLEVEARLQQPERLLEYLPETS
jgi:tetraacyldisaccharide 4'-kinase